jgi:uncharacterized metal-binding protein
MATGRTHARIAQAMLWPLGATSIYLYSLDPASGLGWVAGSVLGTAISPDIDHHATTVEEARLYRLWKPLGLLWQALWWPYEKLFAHRGISHWHIIGTATRFAYLFFGIFPTLVFALNGLLVFLCEHATCTPTPIVIPYHQIPPSAWLACFCAWCIQDAGHILADKYHRKPMALVGRMAVGMAVLSLVAWIYFR